MDQSKQLGADQAQLVEAIGQATEYIMQGVGQMHPAFAVAGLIGAIERIAVAGEAFCRRLSVRMAPSHSASVTPAMSRRATVRLSGSMSEPADKSA